MSSLISTKAAAQYLGVSEAFLERDRWQGARIPFVRIGSRTVRYSIGDLDAYIADQRELPEEEDLDDEDYDDDEGDDNDQDEGADDDYDEAA